MARVTWLSFGSVAALALALTTTSPISAQVGGLAPPPPPPQARDFPAIARGALPNVRQIPVGSASISGIVITADTGRPVAGARVSLNGSAILPEGMQSSLTGFGGGRGSAPKPVRLDC